MTIALGNTSSGVLNTPGATLTFSHTIPAGNNRVLFVVVFAARSTAPFTISGVTYGGAAMTPLYESPELGTIHRMSVFYTINPAVGAANIVVTGSTTMWATAVAADYRGVSQISASASNEGTAAGTTTQTLSSSPADASALMLSFLGRDNSTTVPSVGNGQTEVVKAVNNTGTAANNGYAGIGSKPGGTDVGQSWAWTNSYLYAHCVCALSPAGGRQFQAVIIG